MDDRLVLDKLDLKKGTVVLSDGKEYPLKTTDLPTFNPKDPYALTNDETELVNDLVYSFTKSVRLCNHVKFLYSKGTMYQRANGNLLYHGCVPLDKKGEFLEIQCGDKKLKGRD